MIKVNLLVSTILLTMVLSLLVPGARADTEMPVHGYVLPNGMQVLLHEDHRTPLVATNLTYFVGPIHETAGTLGVSQVISTLMSMRTGHLKRSPNLLLQNAGAAETHCSTVLDETQCTAALPAANLETALWVESDRLGFLAHTLDAALVTEAVRRLRRQQSLHRGLYRYNQAERLAWEAIFPTAPALREEAPSESLEVVGFSAQVVRDIVEKYYVPANARLVLSGDFERGRAQALIAKYFGSLTSPPRAAKPEASKKRLATQTVVNHSEALGQRPMMRVLWLTPGSENPDSTTAGLLPLLLARGYRGLLQRELVERRRLATSVAVEHLLGRAQSVFAVTVLADREEALRDCLPAVDAILAALARGDVPEEELQNTKGASQVATLQDLHDIRKKAALLQAMTPAYSVEHGLERQLQRRSQVQPADVASYVQSHLPPGHRVVLYAIPAR